MRWVHPSSPLDVQLDFPALSNKQVVFLKVNETGIENIVMRLLNNLKKESKKSQISVEIPI